MGIKNDQAGLTLVELLVTIVVASIVTLSACTMLLFGLRINNQSTKTSRGQNTVQVLMEALEDVAAEAKDLNVVSKPDSWEIKEGEKVLFSYESAHQTVYTGKAVDGGVIIGTPFLKGIFASSVTYEDQLLTIDVQTEQDNYSTSIYCRVAGKTQSQIDLTGENYVKQLQEAGNSTTVLTNDIPKYVSRDTFLKALASQYDSRGQIIGSDGKLGQYFSEWYIGGYEGKTGWNKDTPWCACYLSWAMDKAKGAFASGLLREANVQELLNVIDSNANAHEWYSKDEMGIIYPGDVIFFNFDEDTESDHVGVVLTFSGNYIYTIEGNSAGKVAVRKYDKDDKRILGYGVLSWK